MGNYSVYMFLIGFHLHCTQGHTPKHLVTEMHNKYYAVRMAQSLGKESRSLRIYQHQTVNRQISETHMEAVKGPKGHPTFAMFKPQLVVLLFVLCGKLLTYSNILSLKSKPRSLLFVQA